MIAIRTMIVEDLPLGLRLSRQAGWNQTRADWARLLDLQPDGCFVAECEGKPAGTVATCLFGPVAWIAMLLVDEAARGRGIGRSLMGHALGSLDREGVRTVRLDATPMGRPLYESLGFVAEYGMDRHHGRFPRAGRPPAASPAPADRVDELIELDRAVTGADRGKLLRRLAAERPDSLRVVAGRGRVEGYLMARPGSVAVQVGPCIAGPEAGAALMIGARHDHAGQAVFIDIPTDHSEARAIARAGGLTIQRHLTRMRRGEGLVEQVAGLWAGSGPEKG